MSRIEEIHDACVSASNQANWVTDSLAELSRACKTLGLVELSMKLFAIAKSSETVSRLIGDADTKAVALFLTQSNESSNNVVAAAMAGVAIANDPPPNPHAAVGYNAGVSAGFL